MKRTGRARAGFTLIEILLAIGILAVGITSVLVLFTMGARSHRRAIDHTRAALLAEAIVNDLQVNPPGDGDNDGNLDPIGHSTRAEFPGFYYSVTFTRLHDTEYYRVEVLVRWGDENAPPDPRNSESYETVLQLVTS
jgi:prepilin-type N-terminal cleavage/methylation domain-containing protein